VALAIPLSMLGAAIGMRFFGVAGNLMSLGAIDFGLVVDGAVVMVEHVFHAAKKHGGLPEESDSRARFVAKQTSSVASPMFFSVLVILLVYAPVVSLTGVDGKLFRPMALTVIFALLTSLVLALTLVPALASLVLRPRDIPSRDPWAVRGLERAYLPVLGAAVARPWLVASVAVVALVGGGVLFAQTGHRARAPARRGRSRDPDDPPRGHLARAGGRGCRPLRARDRVDPRGAQGGLTDRQPGRRDRHHGARAGRRLRRARSARSGAKGLGREALIAEMGAVIEARAPGFDPSFTQPIQMRFNELLGGSVSDVALSIYGADLGELHRVADEARELIATVPGATDVRVQAPDDVALVEVRPRALEAARVGLGPGDVVSATAALRQGIEVDRSYEGALVIPIMLRLEGSDSVFELARQPIATARDGVVQLGAIAELRHREAPSLVNHDEGARRLVVGFNVRGRELGEVVQDARTLVETKLVRPEGYRFGWGGQYETLSAAKARLAIVVPIALALILLALYATFRSIRAVLVVFTNVPFACVGGIAALSSRDMPLSMSAAIGFIALSGIAVLNGVVYLSRVLESERSGVDAHEAAVEAARSRVRPVMMTALVAALGFVPMMLAAGVGAEVQKPLATVVVGGLVTSTLLTLVVLPTLYPLVAKVSRRRRTNPGHVHHAP
jgi:heavy metal efflux system protein